jgi:hypothetical protein
METDFISSPSIQLSLGGLLFSRARFCFTGRGQCSCSGFGFKGFIDSTVGAFKLGRRLIAQGAVQPLAVVEDFDVIEQGGVSLLARGKLISLPVDQFQFERAPEGFHDGVVVAVGFAAHGSNRLGQLQRRAILQAGVLNAAIGMKDQARGRLTVTQGHVPRGQNQRGVDAFTGGPADDLAAVKIQDGGQVKPALRGLNVSDVGQPDLVGSSGIGQLRQAVGRDGLVVLAVGGDHAVTALLAPANLLLAHQPADAVAPVPPAQLAQAGLDARTAISLPALLVDATDLPGQLLIFLLAFGRLALPRAPLIIAAPGCIKSLAEQRDGMLGFQGVDPLEALLGTSERMPNVFFKMSRCWRKRAFSRRRAESSLSICVCVAGVAGACIFLQR